MSSQMDFMGGGRPPGGKRRKAIEPMPAAPEIAALAAGLPAPLRLGTMTFTYPGWIGVIYAAGTPATRLSKEGLPAYCRHPLLRAVELAGARYHPPTAARYAEYAAQVPEAFRFTAKAYEACTSPLEVDGRVNPLYLDVGHATEHVVRPFVEGLGAKGGVLLFQFTRWPGDPPAGFVGDLHDFLRGLPRGPTYGVEVRNPALLTPEYAEALHDLGAVHCHNVWEDMPPVAVQQRRLGPHAPRVTLIRWLSRPGDDHASASRRFAPFDRIVEEDPLRRADVAGLVRTALARGDEVYVLVSNKAEGCAPRSLELLAGDLAPKPG
jgi:uncharacterized protein YecE (DUF72 family)